MQPNNPYAGYTPMPAVQAQKPQLVTSPTHTSSTDRPPTDRPPTQTPQATQQYPWWRMLMWSVLGTITVGALSFLPLIGFAFNGLIQTRDGVISALVLAMCIFTLGAIAVQLLVARLHKVPLAALGVHKPSARMWHLVWQIPAYFIGLFALNAILGSLVLRAGGNPENISNADTIPELIGVNIPIAILAVITVAVLTPIFEELLFRGYVMGALRTKLPVPWVIVLSGIVFGLIHLHPLALISLIYAGIVNGCLRVFHGNIWASMLLHGCQNGFVCTVALLVLYGLI